MKKTLQSLIGFWLAFTLPHSDAVAARADEIDRVLAAVNGKIITESDLRVALDLNSLLVFGKSAEGADPSKQEELNRLVDFELIRQELENFPIASEDRASLESQMEELKQAYAEIGGLGTIMRRLGLQEDELQAYIRIKDSTNRFVNLRFRPFVTVSPAEIQAYYSEALLPRLKKAGAAVQELPEVSPRIEDILTELKVNAALERWIKELRSHSRIELFPDKGKAGENIPPAGGLSPSFDGPYSSGRKQP